MSFPAPFDRGLQLNGVALGLLAAPITTFLILAKIMEAAVEENALKFHVVLDNFVFPVTKWYEFLMAGGLLCVSGAIISFLFIQDVCMRFDMRSTRMIILSFCILSVLIFSVFVFSVHVLNEPHAYAELGKSDLSNDLIFEMALCGHASHDCVNIRRFQFWNDVHLFFNALGVSAFVMGAVSCLGCSADKRRQRYIIGLSLQLRRLRLYLMYAAIHLIIGLILVRSWHVLPYSVIDAKQKITFMEHSFTVLQLNGAVLSFFIISYYVPIIIVLNRKVDRQEIEFFRDVSVVNKGIDVADFIDWRRSKKLDVHRWAMYKDALTAISPFVVGSLGNLAKVFSP